MTEPLISAQELIQFRKDSSDSMKTEELRLQKERELHIKKGMKFLLMEGRESLIKVSEDLKFAITHNGRNAYVEIILPEKDFSGDIHRAIVEYFKTRGYTKAYPVNIASGRQFELEPANIGIDCIRIKPIWKKEWFWFAEKHTHTVYRLNIFLGDI